MRCLSRMVAYCGEIIPSKLQGEVLTFLHEGHPGVSRMKGIAQGVVWWPGLSADSERKVKDCEQCQQHQKAPAQSPLTPWEWPTQPWSRLHTDHANPFLGKQFLIVVDVHSKWLEVEVVPSTASVHTIQKLRRMFSTHGIPGTIVSDNGTCFTSEEFQDFMTPNGIRHIRFATYHPATNGLEERAVQTVKTALKKTLTTNLETDISRFMFNLGIQHTQQLDLHRHNYCYEESQDHS